MKSNTNKPFNPWKADRSPELAGYTGRIFEREVLGECLIKARGKVSFHSALNAVFRHQPSDPCRPNGYQTVEFYNTVAYHMSALGMNPRRLQVYTAVGSALDRWHGIDGFFSFEGALVTLDCTINPHKDSSRARVLVTAHDAFTGFHEAAIEVAFRFKDAIECRVKGVV